MDINKIIMESIQDVLNEQNDMSVTTDMLKNAGLDSEQIDKLHQKTKGLTPPSESSTSASTPSTTIKPGPSEEKQGFFDKLISKAKKLGEEQLTGKHAAAIAAAIAAGLGAKQLIGRMRKAHRKTS